MTGPIIRATVEDWPKWKIGFEKASSHPTTCASKGVRAFTESDSPKEVMIPGEYEDVEEARQIFESAECRDATKRAPCSADWR